MIGNMNTKKSTQKNNQNKKTKKLVKKIVRIQRNNLKNQLKETLANQEQFRHLRLGDKNLYSRIETEFMKNSKGCIKRYLKKCWKR